GGLEVRALDPGTQCLLHIAAASKLATLGAHLKLQAPKRPGPEPERDRPALRDNPVVGLLRQRALGLPDGITEVVLHVDSTADVADGQVRPAKPGAQIALDVPVARLPRLVGTGHVA